MKKFIILLLAVLMAFSVSACSKPAETTDPTAAPATDAPATDAPATEAPAYALVTDGTKLGVLQPASEGALGKLKGLIINSGSGHHEYPGIAELYEQGFKTEGLYYEYYLSEWFDVYGEADGVRIFSVYVLPNDPNADYTKMKDADLAAIHEGLEYPVYYGETTPDPSNYGFLLSAYVHQETDPGLYNIFFTDGTDILFMVQLDIKPLPEE